MKFIVITKVPKDGEEGNTYDEILYPRPFVTGWDGKWDVVEELPTTLENPTDKDFDRAVRVRLPSFDLGEILVVDDLGREIAGRGRKPSKWHVEFEEFDAIEQAVQKAREVLTLDEARQD